LHSLFTGSNVPVHATFQRYRIRSRNVLMQVWIRVRTLPLSRKARK
jgi:hypothetical protein